MCTWRYCCPVITGFFPFHKCTESNPMLETLEAIIKMELTSHGNISKTTNHLYKFLLVIMGWLPTIFKHWLAKIADQFVSTPSSLRDQSQWLILWLSHALPYQTPLFSSPDRFLCFNNKTTASVTFYSYTANHPAIMSGPPFVLPLLNFLWLLLIAVDS